MNPNNTVVEYIHLFNHLQQLDHLELQRLTTPNLRFIDPFNDVTGHAKVIKVLQHFAAQVEKPHFDINHMAWDGSVCFVRWDFRGQLPKLGHWSFPGVSELHCDSQGLIYLHQDHWDAGLHFYQRLPLVGHVINWIRNRIRHGAK